MRARAAVATLLVVVFPTAAFAQPAAPPPQPQPAQPGQPPAQPAGPKGLADTLTGGAKTDFDDAVKLYSANDFATALVKFQSAYDKQHDPRLLWNEAACEAGLHHYARAINLLTQALAAPGNMFTPSEHDSATALLNQLQSFVATVTVHVNEDGAAVSVDGNPIGTTPLASPQQYDLGKHQLRVTKPGYVTFDQPEMLQSSGQATWEVSLVKEVHQGRIVVNAGDKDAITVDNKPVGVGHWTGVVATGGHQLRVTSPGMIDYQSDVAVRDNETRTVQVTLQAQPKTNAIPMWAWIVGGAVVATGAAVGGYFLFKPGETTGSPTPGTLEPGSTPIGIHFGR